MRHLSRICLITLLLVFAAWQLKSFNSAQAQRATQGPPRLQEPTAEKTQVSQAKPSDYSQEAFVIEQMKTSYRFEKTAPDSTK